MAIPDDFALAVALQMLQVEEDLKGRELGKTSVGSDLAAAIDMFRVELSATHSCEGGRRTAMSLAKALHTDRETLGSLQQLEQQESEDRLLALKLAEKEGHDTSGLRSHHNPDFPGGSATGPSVSARRACCSHIQGASSSRQFECIICLDKFDASQTTEAPCHHVYCHECIRNLCHAALNDRSLIPVRCCSKDFPREWVQRKLLPHQWQKYLRLLAERNQKDILKDLDPEFQNSVAGAGGKLCPRCGSGIQLEYGCNHITCTCQHEFCFLCLRKWRTCDCVLYSPEMVERIQADGQGPVLGEHLLLPAAEALVVPQQHHQRRPELAEGCGHEHWTNVPLRRRCDHCRWYTSRFFYECDDCGRRTCARCRHNRV